MAAFWFCRSTIPALAFPLSYRRLLHISTLHSNKYQVDNWPIIDNVVKTTILPCLEIRCPPLLDFVN